MTIAVGTDFQGIIVKTPPIARKFIGQPISNLGNWMKKQDGFRWKVLD